MRNVPAKGAHNVSTNGRARGQLIKVKEEQPLGVHCTNCGDRWPSHYIKATFKSMGQPVISVCPCSEHELLPGEDTARCRVDIHFTMGPVCIK